MLLEKLQIDQNTLVMFLSDNGGCSEEPGGRDSSQQPGLASTYTVVGPAWGWAQNTPFRRYKSWVNEGGISTPFIARWPGRIKPGSVTAQPGHIIDIVPTCLELAGGKTPAPWKAAAWRPSSRGTSANRTRSYAGNGPAIAPSGKTRGNWSGTR